MRALRFSKFGSPAELSVIELPDPVVSSAQAVVRIHAASINPSDVKNVEGRMEGTSLPRTPGRDFSGEVVAGPAAWMGAEVWGTGGDVGFSRDGTHAELLAVPLDALVRKPKALSHDQAGSIGVNFVVAWLGAVDYAAVAAGETIAVLGAGGGVGGAVVQIAKAIGAKVIGADQKPLPSDAPAAKLVDGFVEMGEGDLATRIRAANGGQGVQVVFDAVGGVVFEDALKCLARRGRLVEISATGKRRVEFDLADFYHNESRLFGADSRKLDLSQSASIMEKLTPSFERGTYLPPLIAQSYPLDQGRAAYEAVAQGTAGRVVLRPA